MKKILILLPFLFLLGCTSKQQAVPNQAPIAPPSTNSQKSNSTSSQQLNQKTHATAQKNHKSASGNFSKDSIFQGNMTEEQSQKVVSKTREILSSQGIDPINEENLLAWVTNEEGSKIISIAKTSDSITKVIYDKDSGEVYLIERDNQVLYQR